MIVCMPDFTQLKNKRKLTAEHCFYNLVGEPILIVQHAGESNKPYFNEMLKRGEHLRKRKAKISPELIATLRQTERELFPKFIVVGFGDRDGKPTVVDKNGAPVPFSRENVEAFLKSVDDEEFDGLRETAGDIGNFKEVGDPVTVAGNSQPG